VCERAVSQLCFAHVTLFGEGPLAFLRFWMMVRCERNAKIHQDRAAVSCTAEQVLRQVAAACCLVAQAPAHMRELVTAIGSFVVEG